MGGGGSDRFRIFSGVGGLGKKGWGQYFRVGLIPWRTLFWSDLLTILSQYINIYISESIYFKKHLLQSNYWWLLPLFFCIQSFCFLGFFTEINPAPPFFFAENASYRKVLWQSKLEKISMIRFWATSVLKCMHI